MFKSLLLGCFAFLTVGSAVAQQHINRAVPSTVKSSKAVNVKTNGTLGDRKMASGWVDARQMASKAQAGAVRKSPSVSTRGWFQYPADSEGSLYALSFSSLAQGLSVTDKEFKNNTQNLLAIYVPSTYAGAVIDSIGYIFYQTTNIQDVKVWLQDAEAGLPASIDAVEYSQDVDKADIKGPQSQGGQTYLSTTYVKLDKSYTVSENGCVIGLSFTCPASTSNIITTAGDGETGGFYIWYPYNGQSGWDDFSSIGVGNLALSAHMDLSNVSSNFLSCSYIQESTLLIGDGEVPALVTNEGYKEITSVSYVLTVDGVEQPEQTMELSSSDIISGGSSSYIYIPYTATAGEHYLSVNFTKVNGEVNAAEQTSGAGYVLGLTEYAKRVSVVEEATSTSCGWCARGTVGLEKVKSILGDAVIPLSIHTNYNYLDPMNADAYYSVYNTAFVNGYPSAMIDRVVSADPYIGLETKTGYDANGNACYKFGLDDAVKLVDQAILSEGTVSLEATQNDDKTIDVTTTASFLVDRETAPYSFVFVLSEDGMTGEDGYGTYEGKTYQMLWSQLNFYSTSYSSTSGYFTDTDMQKYVQGDYLYEGEVYNNVVVAAWGDSQYSPVYGFNDAFADGEILAGQTYTYSTKLDISGIETIQNYDKLKLAVLLVNENNLQIVNAAQVVLGNYAAGINGVNANDTVATEAARYNVAGVRTNDARGLNIVKYTDGSAKKLMVK